MIIDICDFCSQPARDFYRPDGCAKQKCIRCVVRDLEALQAELEFTRWQMAQEIGLTAKDIGNLTLGEANAELVINRAALKALKEKLDNQYTIAELEKAIDDLATWPERRGAELHDSAKWAEAIEAWCKKAREE